MRKELARLELRIAAVAAGQHGVISVWQLRYIGLSDTAIFRRVQSGRLHRLFRGVYAVGHPKVGPLGLWKAATLAVRDSVLSHVPAAMLWEALKPDDRYPQVTVRGFGGRSRRHGLIVHRSSTLTGSDVTIWKGIPVTTPRRTLEDMRLTEPRWLVRKATRQAEYLGLDLDGLQTDGTRGGLERTYLDFFEDIGLPKPGVNEPIGRFNVDFSWASELFAIETDAITGHRGPEQMESDADLGLVLAQHGYELLRLTERQLEEKRGEIEALLRARLGGLLTNVRK